MNYLDKRDDNGLLLVYSAFELANRISIYCFEKTKKTKVYNILKQVFENDYLEIYFKKLYYEHAKPLAHKMVINDWKIKNKSNSRLHKINIKLFPVEEYLHDFLILNKINFENKIDISVIKRKLYEFARIIKFYLKKKKYKILKRKKFLENSNESIGVSFSEGIHPDKRSDLFWLKNSSIKPNDVILYFDFHASLDKFEKKEDLLKKIKKFNVKTLQLWEWEDNSKVSFLEELSTKLRKLSISVKDERSLNKISLKLINKIKFWYLFFKKLNIKILLDHYETGTENVAKQLALHKLDGCSIGKLRSHIGEKSYDFLGSYPNDIFFVPSKDSARRLVHHSFNKFQNVIISGFPYNLSTKNNEIEVNKIKKFFDENNKKFIVLLLDSSHSENKTFSENQMITTDSLINFYNTFFDKLSKNDDIGIIVKTKKLHDFKSLQGVHDRVLDLEKKGVCYLVKDPIQRGPSLYANIANLVIATGIFYPSALIDCIFKKKLGIFFDIANLKSIEQEWYKWGEKKVIFNNMDELFDKILEYKNNKTNHKDFGDWSDQKEILDPYQDNLGSERIGKYLNILLQGFKNKLPSSKAISMANHDFSKNWGNDKILN